MQTLYFDYAATTPIDPAVATKMQHALSDTMLFANASSKHRAGRGVSEEIEYARAAVANMIQAEPTEIIWTSGATESINLAIKGALYLYERKGKHIVTMTTEHKAVLDTCQHLEKEGFAVTYLKPMANGLLNIDEFKQALRDDTILVSLMHVNNETGVIQDIHRIAEITREHNILFHVDAAQSIGKVSIDVKRTPLDLLSLSAHKVYGPKGVGALFLRKQPRVRVMPLFHGGGHEQGMRSGTLATHQIIGMGEAYRLARIKMQDEALHMQQLRDYFLKKIKLFPQIKLNVSDIRSHTVPHIINLRFNKMVADAILDGMPQVAASTASACQGSGTEGSYVLRALGLSKEDILSSIRFSFGRFTTTDEIDNLVGLLKTQL